MKNLRREYSNLSLRNVLEINAPRGQIWTLVYIINIREEERKKRKTSLEIYSGGLIGGPGCVEKLMVNKEKAWQM